MKKTKVLLFMTILALAFFVTGCKGKNSSSYVTIETNPAVELVVDAKGKVTAANGLNEDGKLLLNGEIIVGKDVEDATEEIVSLTFELGFTVEGESGEGSQAIKVSVTAEKEGTIEAVEKQVKDATQKVIADLNIDAKVEVAEAKARAYFEEIAMAFDPTLTAEQAAEMTMEELMAVVQLATVEKAQFVSVKLEEYWENLKAYEFKLKYKEELAAKLDDAYATLKENYSKVMANFAEAIKKVQELEVYTFTNPESAYVQAINKYNEVKAHVMGLKVEISVKANAGESTASLEMQLGVSQKLLDTADAALKQADTIFRGLFDAAISTMNAVYNQLAEIEKEFPETIDSAAALTKAEEYVNNSKKDLFAKFEASFDKAAYDQMKVDVANRKAALEETVNSAKGK